MKVKNMCYGAVCAAVVFIVTRFIQIPIPLGYFNIGNCVIFLLCLVMPKKAGIFAGSAGSALADLTSYPVYTLPTLLIKFLMPLLFYALVEHWSHKKFSAVMAAAIAALIPLAGYTITGMIIYGSFYTGLAQLPGLLLEYAANLIIFALAYAPVRKAAHSLVKAS
jgi:uncharacterized membrane protein